MDIDYFREDNPSRQAQTLADILNWEPMSEKSMLSRPAPKTERCVACHQEFESEPQEFNGHWHYPNLCSIDCGDIKEEIRARAEPGRTRSLPCPNCGIRKNIEPVLSGDEWHYFGQCSHCGQTYATVRYLTIKCPSCGKKIPITSRNPEAKCKCEGTNRPF